MTERQMWAETGGSTGLAPLKEGFYCYCDVGHLDSPSYTPAGSTVENVVNNDWTNGRFVIGRISYRD